LPQPRHRQSSSTAARRGRWLALLLGSGRRRGLALVAALPLLAGATLAVLDVCFPFPWHQLDRPASLVITSHDGELLRLALAADQRWRLPVSLAALPPELPRAVVAIEDRWYGWHPGVNPLAIARAAWSNLRRGRVVSGGSTLAMQLARLAEPGPRRLASKLREAFRALQLTWHLSADERLAAYLNLAPYGRNIEGIGAASHFLFGKPPKRLSTGEIALLVALPRAPNALDPVRRPAAARAVRDRVLDQLVARGLLAPAAAEHARRQPLPERYGRAPHLAPHATDWLTRRWRSASSVPGSLVPSGNTHAAGGRLAVAPPTLATTLDLRIQTLAEDRLRARASDLRQVGIGNAAAVVIAIDGRQVRALVGSLDHGDAQHQGQVNGAFARRSPGSALKPFLFGLAFEQGTLVPASHLLDVPTDFRGYVAENYDGRYRGRVTAHDALVQSLNASTVRLLADLGVERFLGLLRNGGLASLDRPATSYGLPLALGAGEVNLVELTNLYASLGDEGRHRPHQWLVRTEPAAAPVAQRLFSPETVTFLLRALSELKRPDLPAAWDLTVGAPAVAWKTGTSFGHRDAWAIGVSRSYAIGVWVGNFDGRAVRGISGADHAGPLLFDLFRALEPGASLPLPVAPRIEPITVCSLSHQLPGPACADRTTIDYVPGRSRLSGCREHRSVTVDRRTGELLLGDCLTRHPSTTATLTVLPPELVAFLRASGQPTPPAPRIAADCRGIPGSDPPRIVSPDAATPYRLRADAPLAYQQVGLEALVGPETRTLFWYLDGELVATAEPGERRLVGLAPGRHRVSVVDDAGRSDSVEITVEGTPGRAPKP
jgi:penicillin-binding protein 1C